MIFTRVVKTVDARAQLTSAFNAFIANLFEKLFEKKNNGCSSLVWDWGSLFEVEKTTEFQYSISCNFFSVEIL